jgi:hypothetical protein
VKPSTSILIAATISLAALAVPLQLSAQHPRYKLIDLGTLGDLRWEKRRTTVGDKHGKAI